MNAAVGPCISHGNQTLSPPEKLTACSSRAWLAAWLCTHNRPDPIPLLLRPRTRRRSCCAGCGKPLPRHPPIPRVRAVRTRRAFPRGHRWLRNPQNVNSPNTGPAAAATIPAATQNPAPLPDAPNFQTHTAPPPPATPVTAATIPAATVPVAAPAPLTPVQPHPLRVTPANPSAAVPTPLPPAQRPHS